MFKKFSLCLIVIFSFLLIPSQVLAASYGTGLYGSGQYGVGSVPVATSISSDSSGSSGSTSSPASTTDAPVCNDPKPNSAPDLFQINSTSRTSVKLYFSPSSGSWDRYFVSYGTTSSAEQYGFEFENNVRAVVALDVLQLKPSTVYYFKVRAGNGCMPGDWSNVVAIRTGQAFPSYQWSSLPKAIVNTIVQRVKPNPSQNYQVANPAPSQAAGTQEAAPTTQSSPATVPTTAAPTQQSFIQKVTNFFKKLF